jgi:hypothetical protein
VDELDVRQEIMTRSRIIVGLAVFLASATPLYLLSSVTYGVRYGILTKIYEDADIVFPILARVLWPFGPLDWWSYITPFAFAVGVAARIRSVLSLPFLASLFGFSVIQSIIMIGAFQPFEKFGSVMGYPEPAPYPMLPLAINVGLVVGSTAFAWASVWRASVNWTGKRMNQPGEQDGSGNGG